MSVQELEKAVTQLSVEELDEFVQWVADYQQSKWDKQIAKDSRAGRLDALIQKANQDFEAGRCRKL